MTAKHTYVQVLSSWDFLGFHRIECLVNVEVLRHLNAANWHTVVNARRVNGCRQRILRQRQLSCFDYCGGSFGVSLACVLEQLPGLLRPTCARFYTS